MEDIETTVDYMHNIFMSNFCVGIGGMLICVLYIWELALCSMINSPFSAMMFTVANIYINKLIVNINS